MILAPAAFVAGQTLLLQVHGSGQPLQVIGAHLGAWRSAHWLLLAWSVLLVPALLGLAHLLSERAPAWADAGAALAGLGLLATLGITVADLVIADMAAFGGGTQLEAVLRRLGGLIGWLDIVEDASLLGMLVLALGLYRVRAAPRWALALLMTGLAVPWATDGLRVASGVLELAGLAWIGATVLAWDDQTWEHPPEQAPFSRPGWFAGAMAVAFLPGGALSLTRFVGWVAVVLALVYQLRADTAKETSAA
jgi:hypothetical protein